MGRDRGEDRHVTTVISRRPIPGREAEFEEFVSGVSEAVSRFPGHRRTRVFRPRGDAGEWRIVLSFESEEDMRRWKNSDERREWNEVGRDLTLDEARFEDVTGTAQERTLALAVIPFDRFVRHSIPGSALLLLATALALLFANSPFSGAYEGLWETEVSLGFGSFEISETLLEWVNEALMALFFFLVGLEVKHEILLGELRSWRRAALPCVAAIGGLLIPAAIYLAVNAFGEGAEGWGIPMSTDTAFALGILLLLGDRVPSSLRTFLVALAVADDVGALLVIAAFYTEEIHWTALAIAAGLVLVLLVAGRGGISYPLFYAGVGVLVWLAVFESGMHGTIAGVLVAMTVPARSWANPSQFFSRAREILDDLARSRGGGDVLPAAREQAAVDSLMVMGSRAQSPMQDLQNRLGRWVAFAVLPLFALANAGVALGPALPGALTSPVTIGVFVGLLVGKPLGITLFTWLAVRVGLSGLPSGAGWWHIVGVGILSGIGFTMSLFITGLVFGGDALSEEARIGIFAASVVAGLAGWATLRSLGPRSD